MSGYHGDVPFVLLLLLTCALAVDDESATLDQLLEHVRAREQAVAASPIVHASFVQRLYQPGGQYTEMRVAMLRRDGSLYWKQLAAGNVPGRGYVGPRGVRPLYEIHDGERFCRLETTRSPNAPRTFQFVRSADEVARRVAAYGRQFEPQHLMLREELSLAALLERATVKRVAAERDAVVLHVVSSDGDYEFSFAPDKGYAIVAVTFSRNADPQGGRPGEMFMLRGDDYVQRGDAWHPLKLRGTLVARLPTGGETARVGVHYDYDFLNTTHPPDADTLLRLPDLRDGDLVSYDDDLNPDGTQKLYRWLNGELIPR